MNSAFNDDEIVFGWDHGKVFILEGNPTDEQVEQFRRECEEDERREREERRRASRSARLEDIKRVLEDAKAAGGIAFVGDWDLELSDDGKPQFVGSARAVEQAVGAAQRRFAWFAAFVPRRLWAEQTGDALEVIVAMKKARRSRLQIALKVWTTIVWLLLNSLREVVARLVRR